MKKYKVFVEFVCSSVIEVEAKNEEEAENKAVYEFGFMYNTMPVTQVSTEVLACDEPNAPERAEEYRGE